VKVDDGLRARLKKIRMLAFDVDGVLTQGEIIYTDSGEEAKAFNVKDGLGIRVAAEAGIRVMLVTGRASSVVQRRARDLRITDFLQRIGDKAHALRIAAEQAGLALEEVAFMGDDLNDCEVMGVCGVSFAPADAVPEVREQADLVTEAAGGRGAARQAIEAILRAQGRWDQAVAQYLASLAARDRSRRTE
jgi:3-deoxy-D-manno-octulosonate 8-phosphate phosphatase (KDO 8-P phosphatase)